jgi:fructokinase
MLYFGVDLGGTKTETIALDSHGTKLAGRRTPSPLGDYTATIQHIAAEIRHLEQVTGQTGTVGVGIPGCISVATGLVKNANSVWLNGKPLDRDLATALGRDVRVANDANCLALSEAVDGAGAGKRTVWAVILGTGTGSGIAVDGKVMNGGNGNSGEYGHIRLPDAKPDELPGPACYCGKQGCVETWISGPGMAADHLRRSGQKLTAEKIAEAASAGDITAQQTLAAHADRIARSFATVINILDPDVIVLGGGLSKMPHLYQDLPKLIAPYHFAANPNAREPLLTRILPARHGDASGMRGAAWLWRSDGITTAQNTPIAPQTGQQGDEQHGFRPESARRVTSRRQRP